MSIYAAIFQGREPTEGDILRQAYLDAVRDGIAGVLMQFGPEDTPFLQSLTKADMERDWAAEETGEGIKPATSD